MLCALCESPHLLVKTITRIEKTASKIDAYMAKPLSSFNKKYNCSLNK